MPGCSSGTAPGGTRRDRDRSRGRGGPGRRWRPRTRRAGSPSRRSLTGCLTSRGAVFGRTGRRRRVSWTVAVRYSSPSLGVDLGRQARQHVGRACEPLEPPGQLGGRRLVTGHQQRHQLVAQLQVATSASRPRGAPRAASTACRCGRRRRGGAPRSARRSARRTPPAGARTWPTARAAEVPLQERQHRDRGAAHLEDPRQPLAQPVEARARVEPEHRTQDHLEGQSPAAADAGPPAGRAATAPPRARRPLA